MKRNLTKPLLLGASLALLILSNPMDAQNAVPNTAQNAAAKPAPAAAKPATVVATYDVRDLLLTMRDFPRSGPLVPPTEIHAPASPGGGGGGGGSQGAVQSPQTQATPSSVDDLKKLITDSVDPGSWQDPDATGSIAFRNGRLTITATAENQSAIGKLLEDLRKTRPGMVRIRADWVLLPPGQIDKLEKNGGTDTAALPEINRAAIAALPSDIAHFTGQISCFSGQTVHIASGRARTVITSVVPVVAPDVAAMEPTVDYVHYGISLQLTPTVTADSATIDLSSIVSEAGHPITAASTQPSQPVIDRLNNIVQQFQTTVQLPLNKPVLVAGSTADPSADQTSGKELYLILEADAGN